MTSPDTEWQVECYLRPDGTRACFHVSETHVQLPRELLTRIATIEGWQSTTAPGTETREAFGPHELVNPVIVGESHRHSWRKTSNTHNGHPVFQCRKCETAAIEGAKP